MSMHTYFPHIFRNKSIEQFFISFLSLIRSKIKYTNQFSPQFIFEFPFRLSIFQMSKSQKIKEFIKMRISEIDKSSERETDLLAKLKLSSMRTSFANILNVYLNEEEQLGISYYKHALTYQDTGCYEQAIHYAQLAKKNLKNMDLLEETMIIYLNCLIKINRVDEAHDILSQLKPLKNKQDYYDIRAQIMEKLKNQEQTFASMDKLEEIILQKYTQRSQQMGLFFIEKGRKKGSFNKHQEALQLMHEGINILIELRFKDHMKIGEIYLTMAQFNRLLNDLESQYTSLICAHSMIRQSPNKEKELVDILHKITKNLLKREENEAALKELTKIEALEKHIYGESSLTVAKTIKTISEVLAKLNRKPESKKFEQQYSRIVCCNDRKGMNKEKPLKYSQLKSQN